MQIAQFQQQFRVKGSKTGPITEILMQYGNAALALLNGQGGRMGTVPMRCGAGRLSGQREVEDPAD